MSGLVVYAKPRFHVVFGILVVAMSPVTFLDPQQFILVPFIALVGGILVVVW